MFGFLTSLFAKTNFTLSVGDLAPKVKAKNEQGTVIDLSDYYKKGITLVYFYPKADTPGCTAQACSLRDAFSVLTEKGVTVFGVSTDSVEAQKKFKEKYKLPFQLLSDKDQAVAKAFGVPVHMTFASRQAFLIKDGKVIWLDRSASTKAQADDVLRFLNAAQKN